LTQDITKNGSSEIAESRARFEKWFREGACFPDDLRRDSSGMYYAMGPRRLYEAWSEAERDTRERCAQIADDEAKKLERNTDKRPTAVELLTIGTTFRRVAERIRGKE
jgi:hypothetical protein